MKKKSLYQVDEIKKSLSEHLKENFSHFELFYFKSLDSTNDFLLDNLNKIKSQNALCICEIQKKGRGRFNRNWINFPYQQITLSVLNRSKFSLATYRLLSIATAIECVMSLEKMGYQCLKIKWPNDIYFVDEKNQCKKLAGILIDTKITQEQTSLVIGLGLNLSIDDNTETNQNFAALDTINKNTNHHKTQIALSLCFAIKNATHNLENSQIKKYIDKFNDYDLFKDETIQFKKTNGEILTGLNCGIDEFASLILKIENQKIPFFQGQIVF